jgi:mannosyl-oligosaccharide alpha-1,2-mannosidase
MLPAYHDGTLFNALRDKKDTAAGAPKLVALVLASLCLYFRRDLVGFEPEPEDEGLQLPTLISQVVKPLDSQPAQLSARSLRGCCGLPVEFEWVFNKSQGTVNEPFITRLFALDTQGRPASVIACSQLRVNVKFSGSAKLAAATANLVWRGAELPIEIENEIAEDITAEVRIESPLKDSDALLHTASVSFSAGKALKYHLRLQPLQSSSRSTEADAGKKATKKTSQRLWSGSPPARNEWPLHTYNDAVLTSEDQFGNRVALDASAIRGLSLSASSPGVKVAQITQSEDETYAHARVTCTQPGRVTLSLDGFDQNAVPLDQRMKTNVEVECIGDAADKPTNWLSSGGGGKLSAEDSKWQPAAKQVREAFLHAWRGYKHSAWGYDELRPVSGSGKDTFGHVGMTIIDSLTTLWLMGLPDEFEEATKFVERKLDYSKSKSEVSVFELVIRGVGGLLGAHALSGRPVFIEKARDLADRLLGAFNSSSGLPYPKWNLAKNKGAHSKETVYLAEAGSVQLEFRALSAVTGDRKYRDVADKTYDAIVSTGVSGVMPVMLTPPDAFPVRALQEKISMGALADSYYEYLLKQWLQSPDEIRFKDAWIKVMDEVPLLVRPKPDREGGVPPKGILRLIEATSTGDANFKQDHLSCFVPGMIALGLATVPLEDLSIGHRNATWRREAEGLAMGCADMWTHTKTGLAPEWAPVNKKKPFKFEKAADGAKHSFLRPEAAESLFYLFRLTGDEYYREQGKHMLDAILKHGKVQHGFATVEDVYATTAKHADEMHTFVLAETFKYLYLLFSPSSALDLDRYVLNTEGHPLPRLGARSL